MRILIDADAFLAMNRTNDALHVQARRLVKKLSDQEVESLVTWDVIDEVSTKLRYFTNKEHSLDFLNHVFDSGKYEIILPSEILTFEAIQLFQSITQKHVSMTDCVNMAVYNKQKCDAIFSFDKIYAKQGLTLLKEYL